MKEYNEALRDAKFYRRILDKLEREGKFSDSNYDFYQKQWELNHDIVMKHRINKHQQVVKDNLTDMKDDVPELNIGDIYQDKSFATDTPYFMMILYNEEIILVSLITRHYNDVGYDDSTFDYVDEKYFIFPTLANLEKLKKIGHKQIETYFDYDYFLPKPEEINTDKLELITRF